MTNADYRINLMQNGTFDKFKKANRNTYFKDIYGIINGETKAELYEKALNKALEGQNKDLQDYLECNKIYNAHKSKCKRLNKRIQEMLLSGDCLFITLTFEDSILESTTRETRRTYVRKALASLDCSYVANIDYGKKNEREHYHALAQHKRLNDEELESLWSYGFKYVELVRNNGIESDYIRLSRYINKLSNHATKATTRDNKLLYSKKKK